MSQVSSYIHHYHSYILFKIHIPFYPLLSYLLPKHSMVMCRLHELFVGNSINRCLMYALCLPHDILMYSSIYTMKILETVFMLFFQDLTLQLLVSLTLGIIHSTCRNFNSTAFSCLLYKALLTLVFR